MKFFRFLLTFFILSFSFLLFAEEPGQNGQNIEKLSFYNSSWTTIIPGEVISTPTTTSYGFCVVTDGRTLSAFSDKGNLIWEKPTLSSKNVSIASLPDDFTLLMDNEKNIIKLMNPSGNELWTKELPYSINKTPLPGRDGRFFVTGDNIIQCYGINGICKWSLETKLQKNIPLQELPDGTIILFLQETENQTQALRITPFGKPIEEITFSGEVKNANTTSEGIFIIFTNGLAGLFSIDNADNGNGKLAKNKWSLDKKNEDAILVSYDDSYLYLELYSDKIIVDKLQIENGDIISSFEIGNINGLDLRLVNYSNVGLFIADSVNCYLYSEDGKQQWGAFMPENKGLTKWNHVIYTNKNYLVFCMDNWTINGFLTSQLIQQKNQDKNLNYDNYYRINKSIFGYGTVDHIERAFITLDRYKTLKNGFYGELEQQYASDVYSMCASYLTSLSKLNYNNSSSSLFERDPYGMESIFKQLALYGTSNSADYFARLISKTDNKYYLKVILDSVSKCGYDPGGKILQAIEIRIPKLDSSDTAILISACDAVYSICSFMGRPAFTKKGKDIIKELLYPRYDNDTHDHATLTFEKIIDLGL